MNKEYKDLDDVLDFGKYKGVSIRKVIEENPEYLEWCCLNIQGFTLADEIYAIVDEAIYNNNEDSGEYLSYWDIVD